ncbi:hypothetical protein [Bosea sp. (in: a-proteobacteria)]|uniref:helix-turn-helix transcriptional regulator n=1 Tax=Bosea sp. (in: a-proteobacteria) TaxID=1871050 RepID=UPI0026284CFA|nr:hypothetical protein [Bosea sp. (in: a-proteobacteria)]MCO5089935.1 hypothetical protein [Bosea sp. (in: a-proteobacteria)]
MTQIIEGQPNIAGEMPLRFGHGLSTSAQFWLDRQSEYDIRMAEQAGGKEVSALPTRLARRAQSGVV